MMHEALQIIHNNQQTQQYRQRAQSTRKMTSTQSLAKSNPQMKTLAFGSSITVHKLRESKWFKHQEMKILLSVVETGFILEKRRKDTEIHEWAIAIWDNGQEKSKDINHIKIYSLIIDKDKFKVCIYSLDNYWLEFDEIRINNQHDKEKTPNTEEIIRKQVEFAVKNRSHKWHNSQHFTYFCRYEKPQNGRLHQISERVRWNSLGVNLGILMRRNRRTTTNT